jgi:hypothetical protein
MDCGVVEISGEKMERFKGAIVDEKAHGYLFNAPTGPSTRAVRSRQRVDQKRKLSSVSKLDLDHQQAQHQRRTWRS